MTVGTHNDDDLEAAELEGRLCMRCLDRLPPASCPRCGEPTVCGWCLERCESELCSYCEQVSWEAG